MAWRYAVIFKDHWSGASWMNLSLPKSFPPSPRFRRRSWRARSLDPKTASKMMRPLLISEGNAEETWLPFPPGEWLLQLGWFPEAGPGRPTLGGDDLAPFSPTISSRAFRFENKSLRFTYVCAAMLVLHRANMLQSPRKLAITEESPPRTRHAESGLAFQTSSQISLSYEDEFLTSCFTLQAHAYVSRWDHPFHGNVKVICQFNSQASTQSKQWLICVGAWNLEPKPLNHHHNGWRDEYQSAKHDCFTSSFSRIVESVKHVLFVHVSFVFHLWFWTCGML